MKNTWIVTTGSSDIYLKHEKNWAKVFRKARPKIGSCPVEKSPKSSEGFWLASRSLGRIYGENPEYFDDLGFPLWDRFLDYLEVENKQLHRIIVLLTDQEAIFPKQNDLPFWKDTVECKPLFERYLERHNWSKNIKPEFLIIAPTEQGKGIDHWDGILDLVRETLAKVECEEGETIYVSHQAGTPAVSSALQFVSLARFGNAVKFLVTNEYDAKNTEPIDSSKYLRALQLQKAKKLIIDGIPGAALELLRGIIADDIEQKLQEYVDIFNIKATVEKEEEFSPENSGKRIREALDLVEFFFQQENYLAGITLLIAAQETFLKATIIQLVSKINQETEGFKVSELLQWDKKGLYFKSKEMLLDYPNFNDFKDSSLDLAPIFNFSKPQQENRDKKDSDYGKFFKSYLNDWNASFCLKNICSLNKSEKETKFQFNLQNFRMLKWLRKLIKAELKKKTWTWKLLNWSCKYDREYDHDRRNQLVHNLRGVDKIDVLCYLYGYEKEREEVKKLAEIPPVKDVYYEEIKKPFVRILDDVGLCDSDDARNLLAEELQKLSDRI